MGSAEAAVAAAVWAGGGVREGVGDRVQGVEERVQRQQQILRFAKDDKVQELSLTGGAFCDSGWRGLWTSVTRMKLMIIRSSQLPNF